MSRCQILLHKMWIFGQSKSIHFKHLCVKSNFVLHYGKIKPFHPSKEIHLKCQNFPTELAMTRYKCSKVLIFFQRFQVLWFVGIQVFFGLALNTSREYWFCWYVNSFMARHDSGKALVIPGSSWHPETHDINEVVIRHWQFFFLFCWWA